MPNNEVKKDASACEKTRKIGRVVSCEKPVRKSVSYQSTCLPVVRPLARHSAVLSHRAADVAISPRLERTGMKNGRLTNLSIPLGSPDNKRISVKTNKVESKDSVDEETNNDYPSLFIQTNTSSLALHPTSYELNTSNQTELSFKTPFERIGCFLNPSTSGIPLHDWVHAVLYCPNIPPKSIKTSFNLLHYHQLLERLVVPLHALLDDAVIITGSGKQQQQQSPKDTHTDQISRRPLPDYVVSTDWFHEFQDAYRSLAINKAQNYIWNSLQTSFSDLYVYGVKKAAFDYALLSSKNQEKCHLVNFQTHLYQKLHLSQNPSYSHQSNFIKDQLPYIYTHELLEIMHAWVDIIETKKLEDSKIIRKRKGGPFPPPKKTDDHNGEELVTYEEHLQQFKRKITTTKAAFDHFKATILSPFLSLNETELKGVHFCSTVQQNVKNNNETFRSQDQQEGWDKEKLIKFKKGIVRLLYGKGIHQIKILLAELIFLIKQWGPQQNPNNTTAPVFIEIIKILDDTYEISPAQDKKGLLRLVMSLFDSSISLLTNIFPESHELNFLKTGEDFTTSLFNDEKQKIEEICKNRIRSIEVILKPLQDFKKYCFYSALLNQTSDSMSQRQLLEASTHVIKSEWNPLNLINSSAALIEEGLWKDFKGPRLFLETWPPLVVSGELVLEFSEVLPTLLTSLNCVEQFVIEELAKRLNVVLVQITLSFDQLKSISSTPPVDEKDFRRLLRLFEKFVGQTASELNQLYSQEFVPIFLNLLNAGYNFDSSILESIAEVSMLTQSVPTRIDEIRRDLSDFNSEFLQNLDATDEDLSDQFIANQKLLESFQEWESIEDVRQHSECLKLLNKNCILNKEDVVLLNEKRRILGAEMKSISPWNELLIAIDPFYQMVTAVELLDELESIIQTTPLVKLDMPKVDMEVAHLSKSVTRLGLLFADYKKSRLSQLASILAHMLDKIKSSLPLMRIFAAPDLHPRHWTQISEVIGQCIGPDLTWTFSELLSTTHALQKLPALQDIKDIATKECFIETALDSLSNDWLTLPLESVKAAEGQNLLLLRHTRIEEIQSQLDDHINRLNSLKAMRGASEFSSLLISWDRLLFQSQHLTDLIINVQSKFSYLDPLFDSNDISQQIPQEWISFEKVKDIWSQCIGKFTEFPILTDLLAIPNFKAFCQQLQDCSELLSSIERGLTTHLESKRLLFPRFYFVSNDELLAILSERREPLKVQQYLPKCFDGIQGLSFDSDQILSLISPEGEILELTRPLSLRSSDGSPLPVEIWLKDLEKLMIVSVKDSILNAFEMTKINLESIKMFPSQAVLIVHQIRWTADVDQCLGRKEQDQTDQEKAKRMAINSIAHVPKHDFGTGAHNADKKCLDHELVLHDDETETRSSEEKLRLLLTIINKRIDQFVDLIRHHNISSLHRQTCESLVILDVHHRDVVESLLCLPSAQRTVHWMKELRFYIKSKRSLHFEDEDLHPKIDIWCSMNSWEFPYGYEYLGSTSRLVRTPLTRRCYQTLCLAISQSLGGASEGPAGTGKTETVRDLAKVLGRRCVVVNCSDALDVASMAKFFKGIASSGHWCCFDEFNRIDSEVLSVVAEQLLQIQSAVSKNLKSLLFEDTKITLNKACNCFITMNPGYAGRTELPHNIKGLFRPIKMRAADIGHITETMLLASGFKQGTRLSHQLITFFTNFDSFISSQKHYDSGMRALRSVITTSAQLLLKHPSLLEDALILRSLVDITESKLIRKDQKIFQFMIHQLFPNVLLPSLHEKAIESMTELVLKNDGLDSSLWVIKKVIQLYRNLNIRHGVMVVGKAGAGKSTIIRTLLKVLNRLSEQHGIDYPVKSVCIAPKALSLDQLFGSYDAKLREWTEGLLSHEFRSILKKQDGSMTRRWLVLDGPVDSCWIENLNSLLDDNKRLCLPSGESFNLPNLMNIIIETSDLSKASPATITRCGMVYCESLSHQNEHQTLQGHEEIVSDLETTITRNDDTTTIQLESPSWKALLRHHMTLFGSKKDISSELVSLIHPNNTMKLVEDFSNQLLPPLLTCINEGFVTPEHHIANYSSYVEAMLYSVVKSHQQHRQHELLLQQASLLSFNNNTSHLEPQSTQQNNEIQKPPLVVDASQHDTQPYLSNEAILAIGSSFMGDSRHLFDQKIKELVRKIIFLDQNVDDVISENVVYSSPQTTHISPNVETPETAMSTPEHEKSKKAEQTENDDTFQLSFSGNLLNSVCYDWIFDWWHNSWTTWKIWESRVAENALMSIEFPFASKTNHGTRQQSAIMTSEFLRNSFILHLNIKNRNPVLIVGNSGSGKSVLINHVLSKLDKFNFPSLRLPSAKHTSSTDWIETLLKSNVIARKRRLVLGPPPQATTVILTIEGLHCQKKDIHGTSETHEFLRQLIERDGWFGQKDGNYFNYTLSNYQLIATITLHPTSLSPDSQLSNIIDTRLLRHFRIIYLEDLVSDSAVEILKMHFIKSFEKCSTMNSKPLESLEEENSDMMCNDDLAILSAPQIVTKEQTSTTTIALNELATEVAVIIMKIHTTMISTFPPSAFPLHKIGAPPITRSHLRFTFRQACKVLVAFAFLRVSAYDHNESLAEILFHELMRVYGSPLSHTTELVTLIQLIKDCVEELLHKYPEGKFLTAFRTFVIGDHQQKAASECHLHDSGQLNRRFAYSKHSRNYLKVDSEESLMTQYTTDMYKMCLLFDQQRNQLVLFGSLIETLLKVSHALMMSTQGGGHHVLLIGVPGSGRRSLVHLVAFSLNFILFEMSSTEQIGPNNNDSIRLAIRSCLVRNPLDVFDKENGVVLLCNESQLEAPGVLEDILTVIEGEGSLQLFTADELIELIEVYRASFKISTSMSEDQIIEIMKMQIKKKLHLIIIMSTWDLKNTKSSISLNDLELILDRVSTVWCGNWPSEGLEAVAFKALQLRPPVTKTIESVTSIQSSIEDDDGCNNTFSSMKDNDVKQQQSQQSTDICCDDSQSIIIQNDMRIASPKIPHDDAEVVVTRTTTTTTPLTPVVINPIINQCSKMLCFLHKTAEKVGEEEKLSGREFVSITPAVFLTLIGTFANLIASRQTELREAHRRYTTGLQKMLITETSVGGIQEELRGLQPHLAQKAAESAELMSTVEAETRRVTALRQSLYLEEEEAKRTADKAHAMKNECEDDLSEVMPKLLESIQGLNNLTNVEIAEIKSLKSPPSAVRLLMEAICLLKGIKPSRIADPKGSVRLVWDYWGPSQKMLADVFFLRSLVQFDKESLGEEPVRKVEALTKQEILQPANVAKVNKAAGSLCLWVHAMVTYFVANRMVEPKRQALKQAEHSYDLLIESLKAKQESLAQVEVSLHSVEERLRLIKEEKTDIENQAKECARKLTRSYELLRSLDCERQRWKTEIIELKDKDKDLIGDTILGAGCVTYFGPLNLSTREKLLHQWISECRVSGISITNNFNFETLFGDPTRILSHQTHHLPRDKVAIQNTIFMEKSSKWPLFIDPQMQATNWILEVESSESLKIVSSNDSNFIKILEVCVKNGFPLLVENLQICFPSSLIPILERQIVIQNGSSYISLGQGLPLIDYSSSFRLYLTCKDSNPKISATLSSKLCILNFSITHDGLEDQLLNMVISEIEPELQKEKENVAAELSNTKRQLIHLEEQVLYYMSSCRKNIIDDETAVNTLLSSKALAIEIEEQQTRAKVNETKVDLVRSLYRSFASKSSELFFILQDIRVLSSVYRFDLLFFLQLFKEAIRSVDHQQRPTTNDLHCIDTQQDQRKTDHSSSSIETPKLDVVNLLDHFYSNLLQLLYHRVTPALQTRHRTLFSFLLALRAAHVCEDDLLDISSRLQSSLNCDIATSTYDISSSQIGNSLERISSSGFDSKEAVKELKKISNGLSTGHKQVEQFVCSILGRSFTIPVYRDVRDVLQESQPRTPIFLALSSDTDPQMTITSLAEEKKICLQNISLGKGQETKALRVLKSAIEKGDWVLLQNCHLAVAWLPILESLMMSTSSQLFHSNFRLWWTSFPHQQLPSILLEMSIKLSLDVPISFQTCFHSLLNLSPLTSNEFFANSKSPTILLRMTILMSLYHSCLIRDQTKYNFPRFTDSDFQVTMKQIFLLLQHTEIDKEIKKNKNEEDGKAFLCLVKGIVIDAVYGARLNTVDDRKILEFYFDQFMTHEVLNQFYSVKIMKANGDLTKIACMPSLSEMHACYVTTLMTMKQSILSHQELTSAAVDKNNNNNNNWDEFVTDYLTVDVNKEKNERTHFLMSQILVILTETKECQRHLELLYLNESSLEAGFKLLKEFENFDKIISIIQQDLQRFSLTASGQKIATDLDEVIRNCIRTERCPRHWLLKSSDLFVSIDSNLNQLQLKFEELKLKWNQFFS